MKVNIIPKKEYHLTAGEWYIWRGCLVFAVGAASIVAIKLLEHDDKRDFSIPSVLHWTIEHVPFEQFTHVENVEIAGNTK